jgi:hypothetical protein
MNGYVHRMWRKLQIDLGMATDDIWGRKTSLEGSAQNRCYRICKSTNIRFIFIRKLVLHILMIHGNLNHLTNKVMMIVIQLKKILLDKIRRIYRSTITNYF